MAKAAFVVGFTGESGKELVKELIKCDAIQRLVLIGRREVQLEQGHQKVVSTYATVYITSSSRCVWCHVHVVIRFGIFVSKLATASRYV